METPTYMVEKFTTEWAGRPLEIEVGKLAHQANGSCMVTYGGTTVLATAVMSSNIRDGISYFPLMVDYEEKLYAAGKINSSRFLKREGRPSEEAVLSARMIDRSIRPLFNSSTRNDIQVILTILSYDKETDPGVVSFVAASTALAISDIPWNGPITGARVGRVDGKFVLNPTVDQLLESDLNVIVAGTPEKIIMIEAEGKHIKDEVMYEAMMFGQDNFKPALDLIDQVVKKVGKDKMVSTEEVDEAEDGESTKAEVVAMAKEWLLKEIPNRLFGNTKESKLHRKETIGKMKADLEEYLKEKQVGKDRRKNALDIFFKVVEREVSNAILNEERRVDGRALTEIRPLESEVGLLPRSHGSGFFKRGDTHVLAVVTLGSPSDEQLIDGMEVVGKKRFMHHYNFPSYSVGEAGPLRGPSRRDIGHGALAEKALKHVVPNKDDFPYTIRVVSEVMSSNGSSSMGSTCAASLAMMDAGIPITHPVAGIAMGLASEEDGKWKVITDLQDMEDSEGGMDFKVAGTRDGITAIQMDTKTDGITKDIVKQTLVQSKDALAEILDVMEAEIKAPRLELSQHAPRVIIHKINPDKIRDVIGPGGKMINQIIDETGVAMDIDDDGSVFITSTEASMGKKALQWVKDITRVPEVGEVFEGTVVRLMDFGAFVEILPKQDGLVHISEMAAHRVEKVEDVVKVGDKVKVKVLKIDEKGRINLSMKALLSAREESAAPGPHRGRGDK